MTEGTAISRPVFLSLNSAQAVGLGAVTLVVLVYAWVEAADSFNVRLGVLSSADWRAEGVELQISWQGREAGYSLVVEKLLHPAFHSAVGAFTMQCRRGQIDDLKLGCEDGTLLLESPLLENDRFPLRLLWQRDKPRYDLYLSELGFAGGKATLELHGEGSLWQLSVDGSGISMEELWKRLLAVGFTLPDIQIAGRGDLSLRLEGDGGGWRRADWSFGFHSLGYADTEGEYLADGLRGRWQGTATRGVKTIRGRLSLQLNKGAFLSPYFYLDPEGIPITVESAFATDASLTSLEFKQLSFQHEDRLAFDAEGTLMLGDVPGLKNLKLRTSSVGIGGLYEGYLKPVLAADFFQQLNFSGRVQLQIIKDRETSLRLRLQNVNLRQGKNEDGVGGNLGLDGLNGTLLWDSGPGLKESVLSWQRGDLLGRIPFGSGRVVVNADSEQLWLAEPVSVALLDGLLQAEQLSVHYAGPDVDFQGYITPLSMQRLSEALGWPPLAGQFSAMIPGVSFAKGALKLRGVSLIKMFDGRVLVRNLVLEDLFGVLPILQADVEIVDLDLKTLTSTFSFGKITGRLDGRIDALRLEDWHPVSFDAHFTTPDDDPGPHRISQEAVDNISNLGGAGISGVISRGFLNIFKDFGYERLGISCRLEGGVCEMGGIAPAKVGYYLVKGGGVPRIDIVGFNRRTDWATLQEKLKQIAAGQEPIIE